jgi:hypothetical protein
MIYLEDMLSLTNLILFYIPTLNMVETNRLVYAVHSTQ